MSIPNEKLSQLVREIETQAAKAQHEIATVKAVMAAKQRDVRMLDLTASEMKTLPEDTPMYGGVGRMFVSRSRDQVETRLASEVDGLKSDISNLGKKLHYLETTYKNSRDHIDHILSSRG